jgi:subtilisin family serine protease
MVGEDKLNTAKRELGAEKIGTLTKEKLNEYIFSGNYETYIVTYIGNIAERVAKLDYADIYIPDRFFAIAYIKNGMLDQFVKDVPEIAFIEPSYPYTLSELSIGNIENYTVINKGNLTLDGEGVIVGIIGTGIDYLNPRFITEAGESRIVAFYDQTIQTGPIPEFELYGTEYNKQYFNSIIKANEINNLPNEPLPSRDKQGFSTAIAGLIGGRNLGSDGIFSSIAPKCEFAIVNLTPATKEYLNFIGVEEDFKDVYTTTRLLSALRYLSNVEYKLKKPMVVYLPLGCNVGERNGKAILEQYIDLLGQKRGFSVVTSTGSEGLGLTHNSGSINSTGESNIVEVNIPEGQKTFYLSLYTRESDIVKVSIISPKDETIVEILMNPNFQAQSNVVNNIQYNYLVERTPGSNISLDIILRNTPPGIWKINVYGEYIFNGLYDMTLFQRELIKPGTRFEIPNPYTTLSTPGSASSIIATSYYDNIRNIIAPNSGRGYARTGSIVPSLTCEGFNLLTTGINNSLITYSGAAMAGAILTGATALIYQWGIVQGNNTSLYPSLLKNLLIASTTKQENVIYPNEEWGFGKLSFEKLGVVLKVQNRNNNEFTEETDCNNTTKESLYVNIPYELFCRLK